MNESGLVLSKNRETPNKRGHELGSKYRGNVSYNGHRAGIFISRMIGIVLSNVGAEAEKRVEHRAYNNTTETNGNTQIGESKAYFGINHVRKRYWSTSVYYGVSLYEGDVASICIILDVSFHTLCYQSACKSFTYR